ncbi:hypothetical protein [Phytohabitans aurantiacus]|uniref:hypothetical protein n=1 Tax=Phytohabitans aurantiacus TaxID=3016789 RepID=UPI00248FA5D9|nr:hypothetical protein [Phytohabitans aurantiacus]
MFEGIAGRPNIRGVPPLFQCGVEGRLAVLLDGEVAGFRDGMFNPALRSMSWRRSSAACCSASFAAALPFLLAPLEGGGDPFLLFDGSDYVGDDSIGLLFQCRGRGVAPGDRNPPSARRGHSRENPVVHHR